MCFSNNSVRVSKHPEFHADFKFVNAGFKNDPKKLRAKNLEKTKITKILKILKIFCL